MLLPSPKPGFSFRKKLSPFNTASYSECNPPRLPEAGILRSILPESTCE